MPSLDEFSAYRLAAIVQSSDDAIVSKDLNGIVQTWNPAAERMFGYAAEEMIGQSITRIIPSDRLSEEDHVLSQIRAGRRVEQLETVRQRKDGSLVDVALTVSPVRTPDGRIVGASKIARDITERKRLNEMQRQLVEQDARSRRQGLEAENRRIQDANRLKTEFVANMSHELRTPLQAIIGFTELMVDQRLGPIPEKYHAMAKTVLHSSQHLLRLINDVLDLAKVDSGRIELRPEPVDLAAIADEVRAIAGGLSATGRVTLEVAVDPAVRDATLDAAKLKQVLYNYLSNAIKFTPEGGHVGMRITADVDDTFRVEVHDTGIGIPKDQHDRLWVEFQQLDSGTTKRYPGTGLGLAITKRIVEAQGGTVWFESTPGVGSRFYARLPRWPRSTPGNVTSRPPGRGDAARLPAGPACSPASR